MEVAHIYSEVDEGVLECVSGEANDLFEEYLYIEGWYVVYVVF